MNELPRSLKVVTVWSLIGVVLFLAVQALQSQQERGRFEVSGTQLRILRGPDGHYHWPATLNGHAVDFLIDTGATTSAMPQALARQLELPVEGRVGSQTAGGPVSGQVVRADLALQGGVRVQSMRIVALPALASPLLGMDVLGKLQWRQSDGVLSIDVAGSSP
jgi:aspartyl protease family protein